MIECIGPKGLGNIAQALAWVPDIYNATGLKDPRKRSVWHNRKPQVAIHRNDCFAWEFVPARPTVLQTWVR
jgi:hypothetical protein